MIDMSYFSSRTEQELAMAKTARSPEAAKIHYMLVGYYLGLCYDGLSVTEGDVASAIAAPHDRITISRSPA